MHVKVSYNYRGNPHEEFVESPSAHNAGARILLRHPTLDPKHFEIINCVGAGRFKVSTGEPNAFRK